MLSLIKERVASFRTRHPLLCDAILWAIPALLFGLTLRLLLLHYSPYAFWGSDSRSFFGFTDGVLERFYFSINEKRRYLYPIFLLPVALLPGGTLKALALIQAGLGLLTIYPLAYTVRRLFLGWRWYVIPVTLIYTGMPLLIWQEHELIADSIFFDCFAWAFAGWVAFASQPQIDRVRALFWWFFVPFAIMLLTKPSGIFFWPAVLGGLLLVGAYRSLRWIHWGALAALLLASLTVGDRNQTAWLVYVSAFPLTRLDTPLHAEYKQEIRDLVLAKRGRVYRYNENEDDINHFLRGPGDQTTRPLWHDLESDKAKMRTVYHDLAMEGILHRPDLFLLIGFEKLLGSCNPGDFGDGHLKATYSADRFAQTYEQGKTPETMLRLAFGIPHGVPYPSLAELQQKMAPYPESAAADWLRGYSRIYAHWGAVIEPPTNPKRPLTESKPTVLGWLILSGAVLSIASPWRKTLGVWVAASAIYLVAVYLIGIQQARYFSTVWPVCLMAMVVVPDLVLRGAQIWARRHAESAIALHRS